jgi:DNA-binding transcriptional ArsR family regulator
MLRLHFTTSDLARVRFADRPFAQIEAVCAARRLQGTEAGAIFDGWRRRVHASGRGGPPVLPHLFDLVPRTGLVPRFLLPGCGPQDPQRWLREVRATPQPQVEDGLRRYAETSGRPLRGWLRTLAEGNPSQLESTLCSFVRVAVEPIWTLAVGLVEAERARRARELLDGGLDRLLTGLPGVTRWEPPMLVTTCTGDFDVHLDGRGLVLVPSYFCWPSMLLVELPAADMLVMVYPVHHRMTAPVADVPRRPLAAALGRTRAAVLELIAEATVNGTGAGSATGELARRLGVAPGTVSWHVAALREAGLVTTLRNRRAIHSLTPVGRGLLERRPGCQFQAPSNIWTATG